ncbi:MAG: tetraacyldisaccharide 4'-kinase [Rhizobiales bacterium]|nr:tetraacyldisaccharide 4'-kinase [Hyphomicrobiales bacterium]
MTRYRAPAFWWRRRSLAGLALSPLGSAYGRVSGRRMAAGLGVSVGVPIICIGNLVLGGAGKTPTAIEVANVCRQLRLNPGFLSRGYGGREAGPVLVSHAIHTASDVGDEPLLLARHAPTVVAADRPSGAKLLASIGVDVIIMDDGFQNPSLAKDLSLIVIDAARGIGNGFIFPAGPLRGPAAAQIRRADALVLLGQGKPGASVRVAARAGRTLMRAHVEAVRRSGLDRQPYLAFAGIADPGKFFATLSAAGAEVGFTMRFPDHHLFSDADCERILVQAAGRGLIPITTEKDRVRLDGRGGAAERLAAATEIFPIRVCFEEPRRLQALIGDTVAAYGSAYRRRTFIPPGEGSVPA